MAKKKQRATKKKAKPEQFQSYQDCVSWIKKCVYLVVRCREDKKNQKLHWTTLGSGFVSAPNRFITAAHVINNDEKNDVNAKHQTGDKYLLLRHDDEDSRHGYLLDLKTDRDLFLYPEFDLGILYLPDNFYEDKGVKNIDKSDFIKFSSTDQPIGTDIGVLGYPLSVLEFENDDINSPKIGNIILRTDRGVVNCKYRTDSDHVLYEFTLAFNPGNSGGPIFNFKSGRAVSIVKGYKTVPIRTRERDLLQLEKAGLKRYKEDYVIEDSYAHYSYGFASSCLKEILQKHRII